MAKAEILVYLTGSKDRVLSGDPLTLYVTDPEELQQTLRDLSLALKADTVQLKNGDYIIISG